MFCLMIPTLMMTMSVSVATDLPVALQTVDPDRTKRLSAVTAGPEVDGRNVELSEWTG